MLISTPKHVTEIHDKAKAWALAETNEVRFTVVEAAPGVLCSVLGPSLQVEHWVVGVCPEKSNEAGEGSREQVLWGAAERVGAV